MSLNYAELLRQERTKAHAVFQSLISLLEKVGKNDLFLFFEGDEDPAFYMPHIRAQAPERVAHVFVCYGRSEVIKACQLITTDGRVISHSLFFVDKDHTDCTGQIEAHPPQVFRTACYSIENYLVTVEVLKAFWIEVLHLEPTDPRQENVVQSFKDLHDAYLNLSSG